MFFLKIFCQKILTSFSEEEERMQKVLVLFINNVLAVICLCISCKLFNFCWQLFCQWVMLIVHHSASHQEIVSVFSKWKGFQMWNIFLQETTAVATAARMIWMLNQNAAFFCEKQFGKSWLLICSTIWLQIWIHGFGVSHPHQSHFCRPWAWCCFHSVLCIPSSSVSNIFRFLFSVRSRCAHFIDGLLKLWWSLFCNCGKGHLCVWQERILCCSESGGERESKNEVNVFSLDWLGSKEANPPPPVFACPSVALASVATTLCSPPSLSSSWLLLLPSPP